MRGRKLYLRLAEASFENAIELARDAAALRKRGSRGHAYALIILGIEEGAKAYVYKLAGEGLFRIVEKRPNGLTTFSESQLFEHRVKHQLIAGLIAQGLASAPIEKVLSKSKRTRFTKKQVALMMADLLHEQQIQNLKLTAGTRPANKLRAVFETIGRANSRKNAGLYVGHKGGKINRPNDCPKRVLFEGFELADLTLGAVGELLDTSFGADERRQAMDAKRALAAAVRQLKPATESKGRRANAPSRLAGSEPSDTA